MGLNLTSTVGDNQEKIIANFELLEKSSNRKLSFNKLKNEVGFVELLMSNILIKRNDSSRVDPKSAKSR